jgi:predicted RNA methylase
MEKGNLTEAEQHCRRAVSLDADFHLAHNNLGNILMNLGRLEEAEKCYRDAIGLRSNYDIAIDNLCTILLRRGKPEEVLALCRKALELNPNNLNAHVSLAKSLDNLVPIWHTPMMNDDTRNDAYLDALQSVITPRTHVLEIGTGSGLLALMAAKSGAEKVTTCEVSPLIAATAREIILTNGMAGAINVIAKKSNNIEIGIDLPRPADVLVSEIFSNELIGEGVLSSIDDARRRLLSPGGRIIPSGGAIMIALFGGDHIRKAIMVDNVNGFDMRKFNLITSNKRSLNAYNYDVELLTDDIEAFNFDFYQKAPTRPEQKKLKICVTKAGRCYGIIQWIRVQLDDTIVFENHPSIKTPVSGWKHVTYILDKPINVELDQVAVITGIHNRIAPWFVLDRIE